MQQVSKNNLLKYGRLFLAFIFGLIWLIRGPIPIPTHSGIAKGDFRGYWSASYLLSQSQNFSDTDLLFDIERSKAGWDGDFVIKTWNPPWLLSLLLPYTFFSFDRAAWLWFITNITLVFTAGIVAWLAMAQTENGRKWAWLGALSSVIFAPALTALYMGQVNTLVFFGLAMTLFFHQKERSGAAGVALSLTMVKPHLVYITIPILMLRALLKKDWRFIFGFTGSLLLLSNITFILRPSFLIEYFGSVDDGNLLNWVTPTLGGYLKATLGWHQADLMGVVVLPIMLIWWWVNRHKINFNELVQISLLISVITAPFGWGYDVIVLLIPLLQILVWVIEKRVAKTVRLAYILALLGLDVLAFYHRIHMQSEVDAFWIPLTIAILYFTARYFKAASQKSAPYSPSVQ